MYWRVELANILACLANKLTCLANILYFAQNTSTNPHSTPILPYKCIKIQFYAYLFNIRGRGDVRLVCCFNACSSVSGCWATRHLPFVGHFNGER